MEENDRRGLHHCRLLMFFKISVLFAAIFVGMIFEFGREAKNTKLVLKF